MNGTIRTRETSALNSRLFVKNGGVSAITIPTLRRAVQMSEIEHWAKYGTEVVAGATSSVSGTAATLSSPTGAGTHNGLDILYPVMRITLQSTSAGAPSPGTLSVSYTTLGGQTTTDSFVFYTRADTVMEIWVLPGFASNGEWIYSPLRINAAREIVAGPPAVNSMAAYTASATFTGANTTLRVDVATVANGLLDEFIRTVGGRQ